MSVPSQDEGSRWSPRRRLGLLAGAWGFALLAGSVAIGVHSTAPCPVGVSPAAWPAGTALEADRKLPTLVMFIHPECPCTRASLENLGQLMAKVQGKLKACVVVVRPPGLPADAMESDLVRSASALPGVRVREDDGGAEARRFHAETSGEVFLYASDRALLFHGGITSSRGHAGENPGSDALSALTSKPGLAYAQAPVFGCSLLGNAGPPSPP